MTKKLDPAKVREEFDVRATERSGIDKVLSDRFPSKVNQEFDATIQALLQKHLDTEFGRVLEVGVGTGRLAQFFVPRSDSFLGIDFSEKMLEHARHTLRDEQNVELRHADILDISFEEKAFDLGVVSLVLKHNSDERAIQIIEKLKMCCKKVLLIEHVAGDAEGSDIAIVRSADWYFEKFAPLRPEVSVQFKRHKDNILFALFE